MRKIFFLFPILVAMISSTCARSIRPEQESTLYWNLQRPLKLKIPFSGNLKKGLDVVFQDGDRVIYLSNQINHLSPSNMVIQIRYPELLPLPQGDVFYLSLRPKGSRKEIQSYAVIPDYTPPTLSILAHSPHIKQGGSAVVIYEARDEFLKSTYIIDNRGQVFHPQEFMEKGYYISLFTWFIPWEKHAALIIAEDQAGNISSNSIDLESIRIKIPVSILEVNPDFVAKKSKELNMGKDTKEDQMGYKEVNKKLSESSQVSVSYLSSYVFPEQVRELKFVAFKPFAKHRTSSEYGKLRRYQYQGKITKESYHLGVDLTFIANTLIYCSNPGKVMFSGYNGGYGNSMLIHHGLGLYTMYGHCHELLVKENDQLEAGTLIGKSGQTGFATGDHLHFSVLIQGVYADPLEWMDSQWLESNIESVIKTARRIIAIRNYQTVLDLKNNSINRNP